MNLTELQRFARSEMDKHGLTDWTFGWDNGRKRAGVCKSSQTRIQLSKILMPAMPESQQIDTVKHEVAHALTSGWCVEPTARNRYQGKRHGHCHHWKANCRITGADPSRCYDSEVVDTESDSRLQAPWVGTCASCGYTGYERFKQPTDVRSCIKCSHGRGFSFARRIEWSYNGRPVLLQNMHPKYQASYRRAYDKFHGTTRPAAPAPSIWPNGKKLSELTLAEQRAAIAAATSKLQAELDSPEFKRVVAEALAPRLFRTGERVQIVIPGDKFHGKVGVIERQGPSRYHLLSVDGSWAGRLAVPKTHVREA